MVPFALRDTEKLENKHKNSQREKIKISHLESKCLFNTLNASVDLIQKTRQLICIVNQD